MNQSPCLWRLDNYGGGNQLGIDVKSGVLARARDFGGKRKSISD